MNQNKPNEAWHEFDSPGTDLFERFFKTYVRRLEYKPLAPLYLLEASPAYTPENNQEMKI